MEIQFELGNECLLNCIHCSSNAQIAGSQIEYDSEYIYTLVDSIHVPTKIYFTGGEPLLYSEFDSLISHLRQFDHVKTIGIYSSGVLEDKVTDIAAKNLEKNGLQEAYFSLYSMEEEIHDYITKVKGSQRMTLNAVECFLEAGINVYLNVVINKLNIYNINELIKFAMKKEITGLRFLKLICQGRAFQNWDRIGLDDNEYFNVMERIISRNYPINISVSGMVRKYPCRPNSQKRYCEAGKEVLYVDFKGNIFPCACVKNNENIKIANIKDMDILEKWESYLLSCNNNPLCINMEKHSE